MPLVADIHFHYKRAIEAAAAGAVVCALIPTILAALIVSKSLMRQEIQVLLFALRMADLEKHLLEKYAEPCPEALVESALEHAKILQDLDFHNLKFLSKRLIYSAVAAYQQLAEQIDCPLHIGITEAGGLRAGTVKSSIGLGNLLWAGIGDTIRVSLSADPAEEVRGL